jgi:phosphotransferase system enzyme I (PtsI)
VRSGRAAGPPSKLGPFAKLGRAHFLLFGRRRAGRESGVPEPTRPSERTIKGLPASSGVARGRLFVLGQSAAVALPDYSIRPDEVAREQERFKQAIVTTRGQLGAIQERLQSTLGSKDAELFDAQLLFLDDPTVVSQVMRQIESRLCNAETAFATVAQGYVDAFQSMNDAFMRERGVDVRDVKQRVLHALLGQDHTASMADIRERCILVAHDLTPSQTALLDRNLVLGFATDQGGLTSHTAILARSLNLPAVTGLIDATRHLRTGLSAVLDGFEGHLIVEPTDATLYRYGAIEFRQRQRQDLLREVVDQPAITLDARTITLSANIESADETGEVKSQGAEGVGLFRTEYLFLRGDSLPSEEEQFRAYDRVARDLHPQPVIIRTLDLGGDKAARHWPTLGEDNPFMGWRAIRICLQEREVFRSQLRAILRASAAGNVKLMYPMISGVDEVVLANEVLDQCRNELIVEGQAFDFDLEVGVMIEIPSAAMTADAIAEHVDFFSIGTNDLIQYSLAVDRTNPKVAGLYDPTHPGVLRLMHQTIEAARGADIWVGVCGEMAGDPVFTPLLVGLGAQELSAAPSRVPAVKFLIRRLKLTEAQELAAFALTSRDSREIHRRSRILAEMAAPALFEKEPSAY